MMTIKTTPIDVERVLNDGRWTAYQQWLVFLTAMTIVFDGFDNQLLGVALPTIMREWSVTRARLRAGRLARLPRDDDRRHARRASPAIGSAAAMRCSDAWCCSASRRSSSPACTTCRRWAMLRLVAGIGLGGAMPNAAALAAEYVPLRQRPFAVTLAIVCVPVGATLAGCAAIAVLPDRRLARPVRHRRRNVPIAGAALLALCHARVAAGFWSRHPSRWRELARAADANGTSRRSRTPPSSSRQGRRPAGGRRWRQSSAMSCASIPSRCGRRSSRACLPFTSASPGCRRS